MTLFDFDLRLSGKYATNDKPDHETTRMMPEDCTNEEDVFAAAAERKRAIAEQLSHRPVEMILGVVDASGAGGWSADDDDDKWVVSFTLHYWRIGTGPIKTQPLSVEYTTSEEEFDSLSERIDAYSVIRIRAQVVEESVIGSPQANLLEFLGPDDSDSELNQATIELQIPVVVEDDQFGQLTLDRAVNWFTAHTKWNDQVVSLSLSLDESQDLDQALTVARALWNDQTLWTKRIVDYAVEKLLPLKNECWLDEGEAEFNAKDFQSRMSLESITVMPDGSFEFWHADGDMFLGHWILIRGDLAEGLTDADIPG